MLGPVMTARITLAYGNEPLFVSRAVTSTLAAIRKAEPNVQRVDVGASEERAAGIIAEAAAPTLFGDATVLVVSGVDSATDEVDAALRQLADDSPDTVWLIATHPGGIKGKNLMDHLRKAGAEQVDCAAPKRRDDTLAFLNREFSTHKRAITPAALAVLQDSIGGDLSMLAAAISQLCSDVEANPIDVDEVSAYFSGVAEVSSFSIADSVWDRRSVDALRSLRYAMQNGDDGGAVVALAMGLRALVRVASYGPGVAEATVAKEAGVPPWKVKTLRRQWAQWSGDQRRLAAAAVALAEADAAMKGGVGDGGALDPEQKRYALEQLVVLTAKSSGR